VDAVAVDGGPDGDDAGGLVVADLQVEIGP
jgi:hypothetical protein